MVLLLVDCSSKELSDDCTFGSSSNADAINLGDDESLSEYVDTCNCGSSSNEDAISPGDDSFENSDTFPYLYGG